MTDKLREAAEKALEALEELNYSSGTVVAARMYESATAALREALAEPELNLNCKSVQKRLATSWGYVKAAQAEQEPLMDYERINALREGEQNGAEDAYFFVRPENDTPSLRKMFCQGFERGFHKGLKYASHVRTKDLTDDEIYECYTSDAHENTPRSFARAVIAADREKNRG